MQNMSTYSGIAVAALVIWFGVIAHTGKPAIFMDPHALILVIGGTIAAGLIAFPIQRFRDVGKFLLYAVLYPRSTSKIIVAEQILCMAGVLQGRLNRTELGIAHHPLLAEGYQLISKSNLTTDEFKRVLAYRNQSIKDHYLNDAKLLTALAKFPPAFGLLGATTGMIAMMSSLGASGQEGIGPAMAIALVATFWGIAVANLILLPLADHASRLAADQNHLRAMMIAGLTHVHEGANINMLFEILGSFLPIDQRNEPRLLEFKLFLESSIPAENAQDVIRMETYNQGRAAK